MLPSTALRFREIEIFTSKPLFARAEEGRVLWPGASGSFLLLCDRMGWPRRGSCRARVTGVRKQGSRGARFAGGRFEGPHQEAQDCGCIRGQSGQVDSRLAGLFGTSAWAIQRFLRHNRVRDPRPTSARARVRFLDPFQSGALFVEAFGTHEPRSAAPSAHAAPDVWVSGHAGSRPSAPRKMQVLDSRIPLRPCDPQLADPFGNA